MTRQLWPWPLWWPDHEANPNALQQLATSNRYLANDFHLSYLRPHHPSNSGPTRGSQVCFLKHIRCPLLVSWPPASPCSDPSRKPYLKTSLFYCKGFLFFCLPWSLCQIQVIVADTLARSKWIVLLIHICTVFIYFHRLIFKTTLKSDPESEWREWFYKEGRHSEWHTGWHAKDSTDSWAYLEGKELCRGCVCVCMLESISMRWLWTKKPGRPWRTLMTNVQVYIHLSSNYKNSENT